MIQYKDEILENLAKLVAIESVAVPDCDIEGYPFGHKSAEALEFMTRLAERLGFSTENCDNFACHAQLTKITPPCFAMWTWCRPAKAGTPIPLC